MVKVYNDGVPWYLFLVNSFENPGDESHQIPVAANVNSECDASVTECLINQTYSNDDEDQVQESSISQ